MLMCDLGKTSSLFNQELNGDFFAWQRLGEIIIRAITVVVATNVILKVLDRALDSVGGGQLGLHLLD